MVTHTRVCCTETISVDWVLAAISAKVMHCSECVTQAKHQKLESESCSETLHGKHVTEIALTVHQSHPFAVFVSLPEQEW